MARPREFDTDVALAKAMDVFWEHGYSDASLPDLLDGMNLTRGSLYKAFKDKKSLFLTVLTNYDKQAVENAVTLLSDPALEGWERITAMFDSVAETVKAGDRRGCLLCSAIAGPAVYDTEIAAFATKSLDRMLVGFETALSGCVPSAEVPQWAQFLLTQYVGIRIMSRTDATAAMVKQNAAAIKEIAKRY